MAFRFSAFRHTLHKSATAIILVVIAVELEVLVAELPIGAALIALDLLQNVATLSTNHRKVGIGNALCIALISDVAPATCGWKTSVVISNAKALTNSRRVVSSTSKGVENAAPHK